MSVTQQLEKMAHDITSGPGVFDTIEIAVVGGAVGAALGYAKSRSMHGAKSYGLWGIGLGVASQFLLFHALKPALKTFGHTAHAAAQTAPTLAIHTAGGHYTGAVHRGGFRGGGVPNFGPGPWPNNYAAAPDGNQETPNPARLAPYFGGEVDGTQYDPGLAALDAVANPFGGGPELGAELAGWGHGGMAPPYGRGYFERGEMQPWERRPMWWE